MAANNKPVMGRMGAPVAKPKNIWGTVKRLMRYMKKSSLQIALTVAIAIGGTVMQVFSPKLLGSATTVIFDGLGSHTGIDFALLRTILLSVAALYAGAFVSSFLQQRIMTVVSQKTTYTLRNELKAKMNRVPVSYFDKRQNGDLMSVAVNDVDNVVTNLQQSLTALISSAVIVVGVVWMMLSISPLLTLLAAIMLPGSLLVMKLITPKTKKYSKEYYTSLGRLNSQIEETYQGFTVVKSFNGEEEALKKFDEVNTGMYETGWKARFIGGISMPGMLLVQNIIYVLIAAVGCVNVVSGAITIGNMQAFLQYSLQFSQPLMQFSQIWSSILSMIASAERVFEMLDAEEMSETKTEYAKHEDEIAKVVFEHVKFSYTDTPLMTDFSMEVEDGQMVAIVGHTGAGKTTLINLLERFYEIQDGSLRIDGEDIRNVERQTLRRRIGMVLQDTWLFSGTIYDNIKYGNESATDEQIYAAAKAAYADDFIQKLPDGYNTVLNEDAGNISQGQRQLITIARAFVSDPEILILDEATSNVDSRTELVIQQAMKRLLKGRTSFVVAHRLSTIYDADRILVMDKGDIVETGTHRELLAQNGTYADIYNSQFAGNAA
ncbi:ABC transporter ATP-binding protein [Ruminiclostridium cellobioparum]|uniref:ABC transporter n=1 Tax=Ruminiclostridium cellobioparum subsp. termitidis CT1112 TaxID=1195236 RepID=S0FH07_RUMCE|nr:ABC transporter ATP-binding protein [Ruminiclostridium cellobioparum]EMS70592.1 ABC transporter [Ruminiclostridium cellobioparum subsp. termitidis CT1112]